MNNINAEDYGFKTENSGAGNRKALQRAVDETGTVCINEPGVYKVAGTVYIGSDTTLRFENGVVIQKVDEEGGFMHILLNKGALSGTCDENIRIENIHVVVNDIDCGNCWAIGLRPRIGTPHIL